MKLYYNINHIITPKEYITVDLKIIVIYFISVNYIITVHFIM